MRKAVDRMAKAKLDKIPLYHVDAFTAEPFKGNPAAVCFPEQAYKDSVLQSIASEMNLSETAFVRKLEQKPISRVHSFSLRWFTPKTEVNLCGHATLASAAVLFYDVEVSARKVFFETRSGTLTAEIKNEGIMLDFPSHRTVRAKPSKDFLAAVGVEDCVDVHVSRKTSDLLIHVQDEAAVKKLKPDFERMKSVGAREDIAGVIVTSKGAGSYDFVSRFFAPRLGINEDPVTGAAHTVLGPYWSRLLGKSEMRAFQASERGGEVTVRVLSPDRVGLIGNAVIVSKGELVLDEAALG
jgi:PhzF family phenazine biosynthesis protein